MINYCFFQEKLRDINNFSPKTKDQTRIQPYFSMKLLLLFIIQIKTARKSQEKMTAIDYESFNGLLMQNKNKQAFQAFIEEYNFKDANFRRLETSMLWNKISKLAKQNPQVPQKRASEHEDGYFPWKKGQLKLYAFALLFYCFVQKSQPQRLIQKDYQALKRIFLSCSSHRLEYESLCLFSDDRHKIWDLKEKKLLQKIVEKHLEETNKQEWKSISFELFLNSDRRFFKNFKACREMWINHLNPELLKDGWTKEEDTLLVNLVDQYGSKWSKVAKKFGGRRTEHMVKNRYQSIVKRERREQEEVKIQEELPSVSERSFQTELKNSKASCKCESLQQKRGFKNLQKIKEEEMEDKVEEIYYSSQNEENHGKVLELQNFFPIKLEEDSVEIKIQTYNSYYYNEQIKQTWQDVLEKFGCSHPQQLNYLFNEEFSYMQPMDIEYSELY